MINRILNKFFDKFGERVELKEYTGHGSFKSKRIWELNLFFITLTRDYDKDFE